MNCLGEAHWLDGNDVELSVEGKLEMLAAMIGPAENRWQ